MKRQLHFLLLAGLFLCLIQVKAQVGIGAPMPDGSAQLDVVAQDKGILVPRVALSSTNDIQTISNGNVESLLVFNTASANDINPGYYYWFDDSWHRVVTAQDISKGSIIDNVMVFDPVSAVFNYINDSGDKVTIDLESLVKGKETITRLTENPDGTYTYYNEAGIDQAGNPITENGLVINIPASVITEFQEIINNEIVKQQLFEAINNSYVGGNVYFDGSKFTFITEEGNSSEVSIKDIIKTNETKTIILDKGDGTYTYTNENGDEVIIDANTTTVELVDGIYTFKDATGATITSIDTNANALAFDNSINGFISGNVQGAIEELAETIDTNKGDLSITGGLEFTGDTNGDAKLLGDAGIQIADGGIITSKLAANAVTNEKLADNAVETENITDGAIETSDIANKNVTAEKLGADVGDAGKVGVVQGDGSVVYENLSSESVDGEDLLVSEGIEFTGGTDGIGKLLSETGIGVSDGGISTDKLADNAVTNDKLADNAVQTENIADGQVTATDLGADAADAGKVGVVQDDGTVVYENVSSSNVDGADFTSSDLTITNGTGATLTAVNAEITDGAVDTAALDADAVTNDKLADNAVNTENITDGTIGTSDLGDTSVTSDKLNSGDATAGQLPIADGSGKVTYGNVSSSNVDGEDLLVSEGIEFTGGTDGIGKLLSETGIGVSDGGISTDKLAANAVTNDKLADDAVHTENIAEGAVETSDIANKNVTAEKLGADVGDAGKVGVVQGDGSVVYENLSSESVDGEDLLVSEGIEFTGGTDGIGKLLSETGIGVSDGGISTDKLADNAVTEDKLADNAVNTENIADGAVEASDINSNVAGDGLTQNATTGALEISANNGLTTTTTNVQLGGDLIQPTTVTTDDQNTLAIAGLQDGEETDNLVVADPSTGVLRQVKSAMPKFFYMPSIVFDTSTTGTGFSRDLYGEYVDQFGTPEESNPGATTTIPTLNANELDYHITYYDHTVFNNVTVNDNGELSYDIIGNSTPASFMNIVFVVK